jgi:hypothetical protein
MRTEAGAPGAMILPAGPLSKLDSRFLGEALRSRRPLQQCFTSRSLVRGGVNTMNLLVLRRCSPPPRALSLLLLLSVPRSLPPSLSLSLYLSRSLSLSPRTRSLLLLRSISLSLPLSRSLFLSRSLPSLSLSLTSLPLSLSRSLSRFLSLSPSLRALSRSWSSLEFLESCLSISTFLTAVACKCHDIW